eukprot:6997424-Pyramimonas_sp.AAC.1
MQEDLLPGPCELDGDQREGASDINGYLDTIIDKMEKAGGHSVVLDLAHVESIVKSVSKKQVVTKGPLDIYQPCLDCLRVHGDPVSNGLGHTRCTYRGEDCVKLPGRTYWEVERNDVEETVKETTMDSGDV